MGPGLREQETGDVFRGFLHVKSYVQIRTIELTIYTIKKIQKISKKHLPDFQFCAILLFVRGSAGIGRQARLRILWVYARVGSSPISRTMQKWRNWQTRTVQVRVVAIPCGFDSHLLHEARTGSLPFWICEIFSGIFSS